MNNSKLMKQNLGSDWIDLSYGEPTVVTQALNDNLNHNGFDSPSFQWGIPSFTYQPARGYPPLVDFLESKYKTKVVITTGARQGIAAVAYALNKLGATSIIVPMPTWPATLTLVKDSGLTNISTYNGAKLPIIVTSPNNPDGVEIDLAKHEQYLKSLHTYIVHDAAYHSEIYSGQTLNHKFGDAQIFSYAKMYGLSGLRVGYVICHNEELLPYIQEFVERSTSGVSVVSQMFVLQVEEFFTNKEHIKVEFHNQARKAILANRKLISDIKVDIFDTGNNQNTPSSMFGWYKIGPNLDWKNAKVFMAEGSMFGDASMIRVNLAAKQEHIVDAIRRLNAFSKI